MKRIHPSRTLQGKFSFYLSILIILTMSVLAYWNITREKRLLEDALIGEGKVLVESFAIACTNTMLYEEIGLVEEGGLLDNYISDLMQKKDLNIIYAMILDPRGKVLAHNSIVEVGNLYQDEFARKAISSWNTLFQYPSDGLLDISTPLAISSKRWGTLRIGISLEPLRKESSTLIFKYIVYTIGFILVAIIIITFLFGFITKPLNQLTKEMDETRSGDEPHPSPILREDEIGTLQKSFYRLLRRIKEDEKEKERTQRNLLLTEKMVAIGKLTSGVAHEINNPLGGILNCIHRFKKGGLSLEKQQEYLDLMEDGIRRVQKAVVNLLEYARNPHLERSPTDLSLLIEKALSLLDHEIKKNRIEIRKEMMPHLPLIEVDKDQIHQVLINIILNAIQAMNEGGDLKIGGSVLDDRLVLTVSDAGKGITEEIIPKVFDPFFTTKGEGKGTGLGLWISQGIIERHGGTIQLTSQEGYGTTVEIQLPLKK